MTTKTWRGTIASILCEMLLIFTFSRLFKLVTEYIADIKRSLLPFMVQLTVFQPDTSNDDLFLIYPSVHRLYGKPQQ